ncbi:MAG: hypothetical protein IJD97_03665 [Clostridia bacterium]|nr:hypothetical protein [Clostridia bacterium]
MKKVLSIILIICMLLSMASVCTAEEYNVPHLKKPRMFGPIGFYYLGNFNLIGEGTASDGRTYELYNLIVEEGFLMQSFADGAEFVYFAESNSFFNIGENPGDKCLGLTDNKFKTREDSNYSYVLSDFGITPYPTKRLSEGWEKGLTWKFNKADGTVSYAKNWQIGVLYEEKWYLFAIKIDLNNRDRDWEGLLAVDYSMGHRYVEEITVPAVRSTAKVLVDGKEVLIEGYNISGYTYFKLRDVAMALKGTASEFNVEYKPDSFYVIAKDDGKYQVPGGIVGTKGNREYVPVGGELTISETPQTTAKRVNTLIMYDRGAVVGNDVVNIGGYNYTTIRQIGMGVDFHVDWDEEKKAIIIDTTKFYWEK